MSGRTQIAPLPVAQRPAARRGRRAHRRGLAGRQRHGLHHAHRRAAGLRPVRGRGRHPDGSSHRPAPSAWPIVPTAALCLAAGGALATLPPEQRVAGLFTLAVLTGAIMLVARPPQGRRAGAVHLQRRDDRASWPGIGVTILLSQLGALTGFSSALRQQGAEGGGPVHAPQTARTCRPRVDRPRDGGAASSCSGGRASSCSPWRWRSLVMTVAVALLGPAVGRRGGRHRARSLARCRRPHLPDLSLVPALALPALSLVIIGLVQGAGHQPHGAQLRRLATATPAATSSARASPTSSPGCFSGGVVGGSVQATALNVGAGARTRWSSVFRRRRRDHGRPGCCAACGRGCRWRSLLAS